MILNSNVDESKKHYGKWKDPDSKAMYYMNQFI